MLDRFSDDWSAALPFYYSSRKPATDALADLALDNYIEMRDKTVSRVFALKSRVDRALNAILPRGAWQPSLHTAVSFTSMPYHKVRYSHQLVLCMHFAPIISQRRSCFEIGL